MSFSLPDDARRRLIKALEEGHQDTVSGCTTPLTDGKLKTIADRARARVENRRSAS